MGDRPRVLITNAEERSMLAACRDLQAGGYEVTGASFTKFAAAWWSRACARALPVSDPRQDADAFVQQLGQELERRSYATVIAGSDSSLLALSRGRERLEALTDLGLPGRSVVERALSREGLARAAQSAGLPTAPSVSCADVAEALAAAEQLGFPIVLKSQHASSVRGRGAVRVPKGQIVHDETQLRAKAPKFPGPMLVQRWVAGELISCGGVMAGGSLLGVAVSRYRRTWPPDGGSVSFGETVASPQDLETHVERLLAAIEWEGIFELELIRSQSGAFVPIDLNPRPYGSMALAATAGAHLARIWCDWLLGRKPQPARARPGCRYRWEDADLAYLAWQLRRRHYRAAMAPLLPQRHVTHAHFKLTDPLPLLARGLYAGQNLRRRHSWASESL